MKILPDFTINLDTHILLSYTYSKPLIACGHHKK